MLFDEQIHFEPSRRKTIWLGEAKPEKLVILHLDYFLILVGAQHVGRVTRGENPAAHACVTQGSHPMGMPCHPSDANRKANAPRFGGPFLKDFVGLVRTDVFGFHSHPRSFLSLSLSSFTN